MIRLRTAFSVVVLVGFFALPFGVVAVAVPPPPPPTTDFGDAPDPTYPTLLTSNGARHEGTNAPVTWLGTVAPDGEANGQPNATATGDDIAGAAPDDEDGVTFAGALVQGAANTATVRFQRFSTAVTNVRANAWVDFNRNGSWADTGEQVANNFAVPFPAAATNLGPVAVTINVPLAARPGGSFARFRICTGTSNCNTPTGSATNGEVEDHAVTIANMDFGDAPDSYGTLFTSNGARHVPAGPMLGTLRDAEVDGLPSPGADGDDLDASDDEDGVTFTSAIVAGKTATVDVVASAAGLLNAWIDFNANGTFQAFEQIFTDQPVVAGVNSLSFVVPDPGSFFGRFLTYARFRLNTAGGLSPTGPAANGEVEDYQVQVAPQTAGFKCYAVANAPGTPQTPPRNVLLNDTTSGALFGSVATPAELCNPVDKDGEGINDPEAHLLCWVLRTRGPATSRNVASFDQFGPEPLQVLSTVAFCNPAYKNFEGCTVNAFGQTVCDLPALAQRVNHYQCKPPRARVTPLDPPGVLLSDQFSAGNLTDVQPATLWCDPMTRKNVLPVPVPHPGRSLKCYPILDLGPFTPQNVVVDDQFGRHTLRTVEPTRLCEQAEDD